MNRQIIRIPALLIFLLAMGISLQSLSSHLLGKRSSWPEEESYISLPSAETVRWRALGYNELSADVTWARMLVYHGTAIADKSGLRYLGKFIRNIIALDPKFWKLYEWAMYTASDDNIRVTLDVVEHAMREFPNDYEFFFVAGTTYFYDLKSKDPEQQRAYKERGAELIEEAMQKPNAPKNLAQKAASFRSLLGQQEKAKANLMQKILTTDNPKAQKEMLRSFKFYADSEALAEELAEATQQFSELRQSFLPTLPADLFVLLGGPSPGDAFDIDRLATERDLFGTDKKAGIDLFPR